jgi:predicted GNAT family N-acyltransferase
MGQGEISMADWHRDFSSLMAVRYAVFVTEQQIPAELEIDYFDAIAAHFLGRIDGQPVATARCTPEGQIGRMAVLAAYRRRGIGAQLIDAIVADAVQRGKPGLFLNAQLHAIGFYSRLGFVATGNVFKEHGLEHRRMEIAL